MPQATAFVGLGIYVRKTAVISPNTTTGDLLCVFGYDAQRTTGWPSPSIIPPSTPASPRRRLRPDKETVRRATQKLACQR